MNHMQILRAEDIPGHPRDIAGDILQGDQGAHLPPQVRLSSHAVGWLASEIEQWVQSLRGNAHG